MSKIKERFPYPPIIFQFLIPKMEATMQRLLKSILFFAMLSGGAFLTGGSILDAHTKPDSCGDPSHVHWSNSDGQCAYQCSSIGHNEWVRYGTNCGCCDNC